MKNNEVIDILKGKITKLEDILGREVADDPEKAKLYVKIKGLASAIYDQIESLIGEVNMLPDSIICKIVNENTINKYIDNGIDCEIILDEEYVKLIILYYPLLENKMAIVFSERIPDEYKELKEES
ncbi:MAG: hypothetical protein N2749_04620 [Clostridia bacterium]|nr:hypothetical protein [Clostridia bacterium]